MATDTETLEALVDRLGLKTVLSMLSEICDDKSVHVATNWQDDPTARQWAEFGLIIDVAVQDVEAEIEDPTSAAGGDE